jgi:hypothetical protein
MSRLRQEFRVAPLTGVAIASSIALGGAFLFIVAAPEPPLPGRVAIGIAMATIIFVYGFLVSYVYGDARRRGMRHVVWTLVAALVPNALGFIAYFLLREPLLQRCDACGKAARHDFAFCPQCGAPLPRVCPNCRRPVEASWSHCAHCGAKILEAAPSAGAVVES